MIKPLKKIIRNRMAALSNKNRIRFSFQKLFIPTSVIPRLTRSDPLSAPVRHLQNENVTAHLLKFALPQEDHPKPSGHDEENGYPVRAPDRRASPPDDSFRGPFGWLFQQ